MIDELARAAGIADTYVDFYGNLHVVSTETKRAILHAMGYELHERRSRRLEPVYVVNAEEHIDLPCFSGRLAPGYYDFSLGDERTTVIAAPPEAYVSPAVDRPGAWGFALQLYSLRSERNWGIGDFGDLARFSTIAASAGAQTIALNPLHQLHLDDPENASPYSPLSRLHLNALYIDIGAAARDLGAAVPANGALDVLRSASFVDYTGVAHAKIAALRALYDAFTLLDASDRRAASFRGFQRAGGTALRDMAVYEALSAHFRQADASCRGWMHWPVPYRNARAPKVAEFARTHAADVAFYEFLQWIADAQLGEAAAASTLDIGLYRDLAVGVDANSVDVWSDPGAYCTGIAVGAPPDALNAEGQNWGLPPFNPRALRDRAYEPFVTMLRANMRHAGALRIDHVMGLMRLFCIPHGAPASEGAYVHFPFEDLIGVVALESLRNRCMVVGEDLGTVPPGFRERMAQARIFGCKLLYFERDENGAFRDPSEYPHDAVASTGTHDLAPLAGYWDRLNDDDRAALLQAVGELPPDASDLELVAATYRTLSRTGAGLLLVQMEDALVQREAVNVPGTTTEEPNWRRKLSVPLELLEKDARFITLVEVLRAFRSGKMSER